MLRRPRANEDLEHIPLAGLSRRFVAGGLDALPFVAVVWLGTRGVPSRSRRNDRTFLVLDGLYTVGFMVAAGQTPGQRAMGIQVVDQSSGGPATWTQVLLRWLALSAARHVPRLFRKPPSATYTEALEELKTEVARLQRDNSGDRQRLSDDLMAVYERLRIKPSTGLGFAALTMLLELFMGVMTLRDPFRRGLHDRLAGTVVVKAHAVERGREQKALYRDLFPRATQSEARHRFQR